jgi:Putative addiction module component
MPPTLSARYLDSWRADRLEACIGHSPRTPGNGTSPLARDLLASLDGPADVGAAEAWETEIARRLDDLQAGSAQTVEADEALRKIYSRPR